MGNIRLKGNEKTKLRNLPTEQGRESPQGKLWACSVFVLSCDGCPCNLLRQVARLGGKYNCTGSWTETGKLPLMTKRDVLIGGKGLGGELWPLRLLLLIPGLTV